MARMLIPRDASALKALAATPAWLRMPMPITDILATSVEPWISWNPIYSRAPSSTMRAFS